MAVKREKIEHGGGFDLRTAAKMWRRDAPIADIAAALGVTEEEAARRLRRAGMHVPYKPARRGAKKRGPSRRLTADEEAMLIRMREIDGETFATIGLAFDVSRQRAQVLYRKAKGIKAPRQGREEEE